ncbi:hypothetical protein EG829_28880 [bacterium]|nr:hypothetical protein [bacterium]
MDHYEIAGGGIVQQEVESGTTLLKQHIREREIAWDRGLIAQADRRARNRHAAKFIVVTGGAPEPVAALARELERKLFLALHQAYYLGVRNMLSGIASGLQEADAAESGPIGLLGELARILTDSGQIFITALPGIDDDDLETLRMLNSPAEILVVCLGPDTFSRYAVDLVVPAGKAIAEAVSDVYDLLREKEIIADYHI